MKIRVAIDIKVGRVVKYFILVDLALLAGWGMIDPIFSVFIVEKIRGATLVTVGITAALYWLVKSGLQLPFANYLDRKTGEKDDFYALITGLLIVGLAAFGLSAAQEIRHLYAAQLLKAVGFALYVASWPAIFSRHLDKDRVSFDWALDSAAVGVSAGVTGFFGSIIASQFGFPIVFILGGVFSIVSALILLAVPDLVLPPPAAPPPMKNHTPAQIGH